MSDLSAGGGTVAAVPDSSSQVPSFESRFCRISTAERALGVSHATVYNMINRGQLRAVKFLGRKIIPRSEIERLLSGGE